MVRRRREESHEGGGQRQQQPRLLVVAVLVLYVVSTSANNVLWVRLTHDMKPHVFLLSNVLYPICMTLLVTPITLLMVWYGGTQKSAAAAHPSGALMGFVRRYGYDALTPRHTSGKAAGGKDPATTGGDADGDNNKAVGDATSSSPAATPQATPSLSWWAKLRDGGVSLQLAKHSRRQRRALGRLPVRGFAMVALSCAVQNLCVSLPAAYIGGALQVVLLTASVPSALVVSSLWLKARYRWTHFTGATIVLLGIVVAVWNDLGHGASSGGADAGGLQWLWVTIFLVGAAIPVGVIEERWLKSSGVGVFTFRGCYAPFEVLIGMVLVPTLFIPLPGRDDGTHGHVTMHSWSEFTHWMGQGWECFAGHPAGPDTGDCGEIVPWLWLADMLVNLTWVLTGLVITKHVSGATVALATAVSIPATTFVFQWSFLAGDAVQHGISWTSIAAMAVVSGGFAMYTYNEELSPLRTEPITHLWDDSRASSASVATPIADRVRRDLSDGRASLVADSTPRDGETTFLLGGGGV